MTWRSPEQLRALLDAPLIRKDDKWYGNNHEHWPRIVLKLLDRGEMVLDLEEDISGRTAVSSRVPQQA